ncbi:hypothetical protein MtrunA17_Chr8g0334601 [Medicago truncatula]|uniref:Uncharacterized protein n=1 Tax=Medicago truncatula TaxID=3880 RepID=A0A396G9N4_MEDTR|nr:hypothetical protein MtrunA17_Chr8g0334601 [Medicago truncatula]
MHRSLITALQESPSSNYHSLPDPPSCSDNATHFSTPRNQRLGMAHIENNCFSDIDEWLEHANKFCKSFFNHHHTEENLEAETRQNGNPQDLMRMSAVCNKDLTAQEHEFYNIVLPSVREESPLPRTITSCINRHGGCSSNPKLEADHEDVRNKAKHLQLMHRLDSKH